MNRGCPRRPTVRRSPRRQPPPARTVKILLVEDSQRLLRSLGQGLKKIGYAVDAAADGEEGLALAETYEYHVIVLDLMLPGLPGLEVLRRLRARGSGAHVLILSARDRVEDRVKGLQLGADDYLVKPFAFEELCARIQALVRRRHQAKNPVIRLGALEIDAARRRVSRTAGPPPHPERVRPAGASRLSARPGLLEGAAGRAPASERFGRVQQRHRGAGLGPSEEDPRAGEPPILRTRRGFGYLVE